MTKATSNAPYDVAAVKVGFDRWAFVFDVLDSKHMRTIINELSYFFGGPYERRLKGAPKVGSTWLLQTDVADKHREQHGTEHPELAPLLERMAKYRAFVAEYHRTHPVEARRLRYLFSRQRYLDGLLKRFKPLDGQDISLNKVSELGLAAVAETLRPQEMSRFYRNYMA